MMAFHEAVKLVEEQDATQRTVDQIIGFRRRGPYVLATEIRAFDVDDLRVADEAETGVDLPEGFGGGRLTRAGWPDQQHVVRLVRHRQSVCQS